ncbi:DUF4190 domain-containing protein [Micromonospora sp. NPDC051925]|uniref:DUF4190 domain-containing protein n=1 Tax=Micromonospora sp. NPDC051925 TaxID=3364288 RepID=UPI0037CC228A
MSTPPGEPEQPPSPYEPPPRPPEEPTTPPGPGSTGGQWNPPPPDRSPWGPQSHASPWGQPSEPPESGQPVEPLPWGQPPPGEQPWSQQPPGEQQWGQQPGEQHQWGQQPTYPSQGPYGQYGPPTGGGPNVLAILSLVFAFVFAPAGIVLGHLAKRQIRRTGEEGDQLATWGLVLSYVFTAIGVIACCGWLAVVLWASAGTDTSY